MLTLALWIIGIVVGLQLLGLLIAVGRWLLYARAVRQNGRDQHVQRTDALRRVSGLLLVCALLVPTLLGAASWADGSYTTQQTGTAIWTPQSGRRIAVTTVDIQCGGTTAGTVMVWFGALADTTFTQGTDQPVTYMDCGTPSSTSTPGKVVPYNTQISSTNADYILRVTTSAALTVRVIVHGYEL